MKSVEKQEYSGIKEIRDRFIEIGKKANLLKEDTFIVAQKGVHIDYLVELAVISSVNQLKTRTDEKKKLYENIPEAAQKVKVDELTLSKTLIEFMIYIQSVVEMGFALEEEIAIGKIDK